MIKGPKNSPRNGYTVVSEAKEIEVIRQGVGVCWDRDEILLVDCLEKSVKYSVALLNKLK
jgi:hypothetical protein